MYRKSPLILAIWALFFLAGLTLLTHPPIAQAAEEDDGTIPSLEDPSSYFYVLDLYYDKTQDQLTINTHSNNELPISVEPYDFTHDVGSGSAFYAQVLDASGQAKTFPNGDTKLFLGKWSMAILWDGADQEGKPIGGTKELDKGTVKVSVPYFPDGYFLNIHRSSNDEQVLSINVEAFSKEGQEAFQTAVQTAKAEQAQLEASQNQSKTSLVAWIVVGIFALALIIIGVIIWVKKIRRS